MPHFDPVRRRRALGAAALVSFAVAAWAAAPGALPPVPPPITGAPAPDATRSVAAFQRMATVLRHPRCLNCHPATDYPKQGDAMRPHAMRVKRGPDNHGTAALKCVSCHRDSNQANGVPGAPHWGLAPLSQAWEGLDDHQLAEALKDRAKNGDRDLEKLFHHLAHDPLVAWAWAPGGTRTTPPIPHEEFTALVREWIDTGAASPPPSGAAPLAPAAK